LSIYVYLNDEKRFVLTYKLNVKKFPSGFAIMNNDQINKEYYNWDISKGDYHRDYESTLRYEKKLKTRKNIKGMARIFLYIGIFVTTLSFLAFYFF